MPNIYNNNYIGWPFFRGYQKYRPRENHIALVFDSCNMILAWAIFSGIPFKARQYNIIIIRIRHLSWAFLKLYCPRI